jgi:hypothetical protein
MGATTALAGGSLAVQGGATDPQSWAALIIALTGLAVAIYPMFARERARRNRDRRRRRT